MAAAAQDLRTVDLPLFAATPLEQQPFPHLIVPGFLKAEAIDAINADYPAIGKPGSFPVSELTCGPAFEQLIKDLNSSEMTAAFADKFRIDLSDHPIMITVRGRTQAKDGRIHTDSRTKIITVLIYMNGAWEAEGGRLRLLRSADDLEDHFAEVPPIAGTMLAFLNTENAWHGHKQHIGERRTIQLNWVTDAGVVAREQARHRFSARLKRFNPFA
ncbi:MAG TPA: 2OG-Fe(II) oxygenase [Alphaproteobacteria bacterium]|nr:2OG-Fe(II) oxygenase [Alphaproteobacteria bacterium]